MSKDKGQLVFESILDVPPEWIKNDTIVECQYITENRLIVLETFETKDG